MFPNVGLITAGEKGQNLAADTPHSGWRKTILALGQKQLLRVR